MRNFIKILVLLFIISCGSDASAASKAILVGRVANGEIINPEHPFEKSIVTILDYRGDFGCTGTILSRNSILTAAHCLTGYYYSAVINGKKYPVEKRIIYPEYRRNNELDIAIAVLKTNIELSDFYPVTLDSNKSIPKSLSVIGRSLFITSIYSDYVTALLKLLPEKYMNTLNADASEFIENLPMPERIESVNETHQSYTKKIYRSESLNVPKSANIFFNNFGGGPQKGDSGGAVIVENKDGSFFQRGITQFVKMNYKFPNSTPYRNYNYHVFDSTGYANISYYIPWLKKMAKENELGEIKIKKSNAQNLTVCEEVKFKLNEQFIEKLSFNLFESIISNNCAVVDPKILTMIESSTEKCLNVCGEIDQTCRFANDSVKTYKSFLEKACL